MTSPDPLDGIRGVSVVMLPLYRAHGWLATREVVRGIEGPGLALRAVRYALDVYEMGQMFGWRGSLDAILGRP